MIIERRQRGRKRISVPVHIRLSELERAAAIEKLE
jgi:hypothetical protein